MTIAIGRCCLVEILRDIGWTQQDLADASGLHKRTISFYATNRRKRMPLVMAVIITDALNVRSIAIEGRVYSPRDLYVWITK
jgi:transcriptional regulator with XRE-family HTH domain